MPTEEFKDFPILDCIKAVEKITADGTWTAFQKFTCQHCGSRQTMDVPNKFYTTGICQKCDSVTNIEQRGCNYMLVAAL